MVVKKAMPMRNSQGVVVVNERGELVPRPTTIYDAVTQMYVRGVEDVNPVPVLCHREHLRPVGVCRVCLVEIEERRKSGRVKKDLVSACTYHVKDGMVITTLASRENPKTVETIRDSVGVIVELLAAEHLSEGEREGLVGLCRMLFMCGMLRVVWRGVVGWMFRQRLFRSIMMHVCYANAVLGLVMTSSATM